MSGVVESDGALAEGEWRVFPPMELPPILEAALGEIVRHGYDAVTVRNLARAAGVTVPLLYYHYENKQAMLAALLDHAMTIVATHLDAAVAEAGADPVARLRAVVETIVLYMANHPDLAFLDAERRSLTPENLAAYITHRDRIESALRSAVREGCASGMFGTTMPEACARAILSMCQGIPGWFRAEGPQTAEDLAEEYVHIALAAVEQRHG